MVDCPFCNVPRDRILRGNDFAVAIGDGYPVSPGHALIIPIRHVASFFETTDAERQAIFDLVRQAGEDLKKARSPDGFNIGINDGEAAGQSVMHLHVHLIPRFKADVPDPRGGVRLIFPEKAAYWDEETP